MKTVIHHLHSSDCRATGIIWNFVGTNLRNHFWKSTYRGEIPGNHNNHMKWNISYGPYEMFTAIIKLYAHFQATFKWQHLKTTTLSVLASIQTYFQHIFAFSETKLFFYIIYFYKINKTAFLSRSILRDVVWILPNSKTDYLIVALKNAKD